MKEIFDESQWLPEVLPTKERMAKRDVKVVHSERGGISIRARNLSDILMYYQRSGFITVVQRRAAFKYRSLFFLSGMKSRYVVSRYCEMPSGEPMDVQEAQEEYNLARAAIRGKTKQAVCFTVCCIGDKAGSPRNMDHLRNALDDLIKHFGYEDSQLKR